MEPDDDFPALQTGRPRLMPLSLGPLAITELRAYIAELHVEVARAEAEIILKKDHRNAADGFFRKP